MDIIKTNVKIEDLTKQADIVIVCVSTPWCGPCKTLTPILENIQAENDKIKIFKIELGEDNHEMGIELGIRSVPTLLFYKGGNQVAKEIGAMSKDKILKVIEEKLEKELKEKMV